MSDLRVSNLKGRTPGSSPILPDGIRVTGVGTFSSDVEVAGNLNVTGDLVYDEVTGRNLNISGIATVGTQFYPPVLTTTQRDALTVSEGCMIFNTTTKKIEFYDGTSWNTLPGMSLGLTVALDG